VKLAKFDLDRGRGSHDDDDISFCSSGFSSEAKQKIKRVSVQLFIEREGKRANRKARGGAERKQKGSPRVGAAGGDETTPGLFLFLLLHLHKAHSALPPPPPAVVAVVTFPADSSTSVIETSPPLLLLLLLLFPRRPRPPLLPPPLPLRRPRPPPPPPFPAPPPPLRTVDSASEGRRRHRPRDTFVPLGGLTSSCEE
jgi:hypothetical protein